MSLILSRHSLNTVLGHSSVHGTVWVQTLEAQLEQNPTGLMADFVAYNPETYRYEPVLGKVRLFTCFVDQFSVARPVKT